MNQNEMNQNDCNTINQKINLPVFGEYGTIDTENLPVFGEYETIVDTVARLKREGKRGAVTLERGEIEDGVIMVDLKQLTLPKRYINRIKVEAIVRSIWETKRLFVPVKISRKHKVRDGLLRCKAFEALGLEQIPCIVED